MKKDINQKDKNRVTADMLNRMIDEESRRRGFEPTKNNNKKGTKKL